MAATARAHIVLPAELLDQIDCLVGKRKRSQFIVEALEERLRRQRLMKAVEDVIASEPVEGPPEWATPESSAQWVHDLRREESNREKRLREDWYEAI